jgi:hypothetical protein
MEGLLSRNWPGRSRAPRSSPGPRDVHDYRVSEPGYRYQLILHGECGPLTAWLSGDAAIESGDGCTSVIFSARGDSELYGLFHRIQDVALHLISLNQIGSTSSAT